MGKLFKVAMFVTSFIPLWITVIFIDTLSIFKNNSNLMTEIASIITIIILNLFSILVIYNSMSSIKTSEYKPYIILDVQQEKGITSEFLLSYVLPLFTFQFTQWDGVIQFLIYFIVLAFLCVRNNNVYANLIFEIRRFKFYNCELQWKPETSVKSIQATVISRENLSSQRGNTIDIAPLNKPFHLNRW